MSQPDRYRRHRLRALDYLLALALFVGYLALLVSTMDMGFTRDEGYYFAAGERYYGWFDELEQNTEAGHREDSFTQANIDRHWEYNPEHPVLMKTLFGLSWHAFSQERDWMSPTTAMRFPAAVFASLLMALVFLFFREAFGSRLFGLVAVAATGFQPHVFFHSHLACFDAPITAAWFLVVYAYWKSYNSRLWAWLTGIGFGIALIVKLNAFFIPVVLLAHWAWAGRREFSLPGRGWRRRLTIPKIPLAFVAMVTLGPLIFYLGWPRHWFDTFNRITWYFGRHWHHEHYYVYYFGEALVRPPFPVSYPFVMTLVTVPLVILLTGALGGGVLGGRSWRSWRRRSDAGGPVFDRRGTGFLIAINLFFPILLIAQPSTPVFGGTKHWMNAMPFLGLLSGVGAMWAFERVRASWGSVRGATEGGGRRLLGWALSSVVAVAFVAVLVAPMVHATLYVHPFGISYYNELVGGVRGAADRQMMRQFWGYSTRAGLSYFNEVAPEGASVYPHNANWDAMRWYEADGLLREDIRDMWQPNRADYSFFNHQKAFIPEMRNIWEAYDTTAPIRVWTVNGVPVFSLYGDTAAQLRSQVPPPAAR